MESEMIQALQTIADNIQAASQPGWVECLSVVISSISVVVSGVAIWFAIRVPKEIALRQEEIQRRQIRVQTYVYKIEYLRTFYKLKDDMQALQSVFVFINLGKENFHRAYERYSKLNIQRTEIMMALQQSKSVFTAKSWVFLDRIRNEFKVIDDTYRGFNLYASIMTETEQREREEERKSGLRNIQATLSLITHNLDCLLKILNEDIAISDIHKMM